MLAAFLHRPTLRRAAFSLPLLATLPAFSQAPASSQPHGKTFEVVSIRQNMMPSQRSGPPNFAPEPNGFRVTRRSMSTLLLVAYVPTGSSGQLFVNNIQGLPDWGKNDYYDIDARVADTDRAAWQDPANQPAMLQQMLQTMLTDRFHLAVHRVTQEKPVYDLVVTKSGPKFHETSPDEPRPTGATLPGGGVMSPGADGATHMYNFSMGLLASLLSEKADRPVLDKTGLTGHYSIDIREPARVTAPSTSPNGESQEERMPAVADVLKSVGLELKSAKEQIETLVVDHVERPTEN